MDKHAEAFLIGGLHGVLGMESVFGPSEKTISEFDPHSNIASWCRSVDRERQLKHLLNARDKSRVNEVLGSDDFHRDVTGRVDDIRFWELKCSVARRQT